jgi:hypothetical protein
VRELIKIAVILTIAGVVIYVAVGWVALAIYVLALVVALTWVVNNVDPTVGARKVCQIMHPSKYAAAQAALAPPVQVACPVSLKSGEQARLTTAAELGRYVTRTRYVGMSHGVSFPIGKTGIRYRIGAYSGHPVSTTGCSVVDRGVLSLTTTRLVFIGEQKSVTTPLGKILSIKPYSNALEIFQEGREAPNIYFVKAPKAFLRLLEA